LARSYQHQGWGEFKPGRGARVCEILSERRHLPTLLELDDGSTIETVMTAFGRDVGEEWEHIYANMGVDSVDTHLVETSKIVRLIDVETGACLYQRARSHD